MRIEQQYTKIHHARVDMRYIPDFGRHPHARVSTAIETNGTYIVVSTLEAYNNNVYLVASEHGHTLANTLKDVFGKTVPSNWFRGRYFPALPELTLCDDGTFHLGITTNRPGYYLDSTKTEFRVPIIYPILFHRDMKHRTFCTAVKKFQSLVGVI